MVLLLPRLSGPAADDLLEAFRITGPDGWAGFDSRSLPGAVRYAATGGARATADQLLGLRNTILNAARSSGYGEAGGRSDLAGFDADLSSILTQEKILSSGEALRDDFWTFVGVVLAPDIVHWRFGTARKRYLGGVRNTYQRMWVRGQALDRGGDHPDRWRLLRELTEDALVQITERPSIGADRILAQAIGEAWVRAADFHGRNAMEQIMRRAVLQVRIRNEIRSLADLPGQQLAKFLDGAFGVSSEMQEGVDWTDTKGSKGSEWLTETADKSDECGTSYKPHKYPPKQPQAHEVSTSFFKSSGSSEFVNFIRCELQKFATPDLWNIGGASSLTADFRPATNAISMKHGFGLKAQIWMERPKNAAARCKFEVAYDIPDLDPAENVRLREMIAFDIREHMLNLGLPDGVEVARKSTVCALRFSDIYEHEYADEKSRTAGDVSRAIRTYIEFLENSLNSWAKGYLC